MAATPRMKVHTRSADGVPEKPFEKSVVLPDEEDQDPSRHAWADARFATDIMAEHGIFFALLMPPEVAERERQQALRFSKTFAKLHRRIDAAPAPRAGRPPAFHERGRGSDEAVHRVQGNVW